jgi:hypothetical protein
MSVIIKTGPPVERTASISIGVQTVSTFSLPSQNTVRRITWIPTETIRRIIIVAARTTVSTITTVRPCTKTFTFLALQEFI